MQWTAGCTKNCSDETFCKASVNPPCLLECCNATSWSCLWLNGTLNTPSAATRGPLPMAELVAVLLCLLAFTLLQWATEVPRRVAPVRVSRSKALHNPRSHQKTLTIHSVTANVFFRFACIVCTVWNVTLIRLKDIFISGSRPVVLNSILCNHNKSMQCCLHIHNQTWRKWFCLP